jgi:RHS repeat-associated protein
VGNRLSQETGIGTTNYVYDNANRLTSVNGTSYTWDNNGNLLNDGVNTYTYDSANRLKTFTNATTTATYRYNGLNDRLQETVNGVTTTFTMDLNTGLTQALSDGTNTYIYGVGRIAQVNSNGTEYFLGDALGSVRQLTSASGAITYASVYDPYGVTTQAYGASQTGYGFTGEYTSQGLVYLRARYYMPTDGRFLTRDTWMGDYHSPLSLNRWIYVEGNPINRTDPSGQCYIDGGNMRRWKVWEYPIIGPCRDNSGPISPDYPHYHDYSAFNLVCSAWLSCSQDEVVDALSRFTFPGQDPSKPVQLGEENFVPPFVWFKGYELGGLPVERLGAIHSIIFSAGLHVRNVSEPTHIFHKGQVDRQATPVGNAWYVQTHGTGNNIYFLMDYVNQVSGGWYNENCVKR